ncbi:MAG: hypothetical protein F6J92_08010 [Symploca sp. SIO1A3]|nr:hypothetical protein [Symploca sp. SIO1A3]
MQQIDQKKEKLVTSILTGKKISVQEMEKEADIIVTATVLGFIRVRYKNNEPCRFDIEHPSPITDYQTTHGKPYKLGMTLDEYFQQKNWSSDKNVGKRVIKQDRYEKFLRKYQDLLHVLSIMSKVLHLTTEPKIGKFLQDGQSNIWDLGALITGLPEGGKTKFDKRHRQILKGQAKVMKEYIARNPNQSQVYFGRGAYTGMIYDPKNLEHSFYAPTRRVIDQNKFRWDPGVIEKHPLGLIKGNESSDLSKGLGPLPRKLNRGERIGYIHGMSSAINECVKTDLNYEKIKERKIKEQEKCIPFEMATGKLTTKMASCFACCTYMYAAGYPPSSMHLGRGESWVPPTTDLINGEKNRKLQTFDKKISGSLAKKWHSDIFTYLELGLETLVKVSTSIPNSLSQGYQEHVKNLWIKLQSLENHKDEIGGNLFLDALTYHKPDWQRIKDVFQPVYDGFKLKQRVPPNKLVSMLGTSMVSSDEEVLLNGMKVIFDDAVPVEPVSLIRKDEVRPY